MTKGYKNSFMIMQGSAKKKIYSMIRKCLALYLNDTIILHKNMHEHQRNIEEVIRRSSLHNFRKNHKKHNIFSIKYMF